MNRHLALRKEILRLVEDNKELRQALFYYDSQILRKWKEKKIKIRIDGQPDVFVPITSLKSVKFPENLSDMPEEPVQVSAVLLSYLKKLATTHVSL